MAEGGGLIVFVEVVAAADVCCAVFDGFFSIQCMVAQDLGQEDGKGKERNGKEWIEWTHVIKQQVIVWKNSPIDTSALVRKDTIFETSARTPRKKAQVAKNSPMKTKANMKRVS